MSQRLDAAPRAGRSLWCSDAFCGKGNGPGVAGRRKAGMCSAGTAMPGAGRAKASCQPTPYPRLEKPRRFGRVTAASGTER